MQASESRRFRYFSCFAGHLRVTGLDAVGRTVIKDALLAAGFLFSSLAPEDLDQVVMAMSEKQLPKGHTIIRQGVARPPSICAVCIRIQTCNLILCSCVAR
jgi:hypothetical protein